MYKAKLGAVLSALNETKYQFTTIPDCLTPFIIGNDMNWCPEQQEPTIPVEPPTELTTIKAPVMPSPVLSGNRQYRALTTDDIKCDVADRLLCVLADQNKVRSVMIVFNVDSCSFNVSMPGTLSV